MINRKQYVISKDRFVADEFLSIELQCGMILSYHRDMRVESTDDRRTVLLGDAFSCVKDDAEPISEISLCRSRADVEDATSNWAGRWLLVHNGDIYLDACGLLGCFYSNGVYSSSLNILNRILRRKNINPHLMSGCGLDFYPGPGTPFADTMRLMPGQGISIVSNELFKRALYCDTPPYLAEGCANAIVEDFKHIIRNFARRFSARKIVASANAGLDSRILIALLEHNHVDYSIITFDHKNISVDDFQTPPKIAAALGRDYAFVMRRGKSDASRRLRDFDKHSSMMTTGEIRDFYAHKQLPLADNAAGAVLLRSGVWGVPRKYYAGICRTGDFANDVCQSFVNVKYRPDINESVRKWCESEDLSLPRSSQLGIFHISQRMGCGLSDVEQSLDVVDGLDTAHLFNCRRHLSMLKGVREKTGDFHPIRQEILRLACPRLLDFPIPEEPGPLHHQSKMPHLCRIMGRMRHTILSYLYCLGWRGTLRLLADERIKRPLANRSEKRARGTQFCGMKSAVDAIKAEDGSRASPLIFTCAGDVADIIYSLPVCREMAGKLGHATFRYNVDPRIGRRTATASPCERRSILRLLEHVPYISEVTFSAQLPPYVIDIGRTFPRVAFGFSRNGGSRRSWFLHDGTCIMPDFSRPWLKKEMTLVVPRKVILHCSGRSVASRLDLSSLAKYKDEIVFWGTSEEHNAFCGKFFDVEFKQISSYTDLASWVANARFVIDTGSELFALAESMKVPRLLIAANSSRLNGLQDSSCQHLTNARDAEIVVGEFFKRYCDDVETQVAVGGAEPSVHSYDAWNSIKSAAKANAHVIIPVYGNAPMLVSCVASVLEYTPENVPIMLIDDASPDADIVTSMGKLKTMAPDRITVVRNPANMGFVRTCNKAMQLAGNADVVLLNSDTIVSPRWFVNLRIAAYSSARAGTATAISNKAYFCSVPECYSYNSRHTNEIPAGHSVASVGRMFLQSNEIWYDFLAGNGFCMYIKRAMIRDVGTLDADAFGQGYGEEVDLCFRAFKNGWSHRVSSHSYVWHHNAASFGIEKKSESIAKSRAIISKRYPDCMEDYGKSVRSLERLRTDYRKVYSALWDGRPALPRLLIVCRTGLDAYYEAAMGRLNELVADYSPLLFAFNDDEAMVARLSKKDSNGSQARNLCRCDLKIPPFLGGRFSDELLNVFATWVLQLGIEYAAIDSGLPSPEPFLQILDDAGIKIINGDSIEKNDLLVRHSKLSFDTIGTRSDVRIYVCQPGYDSHCEIDREDWSKIKRVLVEPGAVPSTVMPRLEFMSRFYGFPIDSVDPGVPGACAESREGA